MTQPMSAPRRRWRNRTATVALGAALVLAACGDADELPSPDPPDVGEDEGQILTEERFEEILTDIDDTITDADDEQDPELLSDRVGGPAFQVRSEEYELIDATDGDSELSPITMETQLELFGATREYPRTAMAVTQVPEGGNLPLFVTVSSPEPRDDYQLWSWVELFPGATVPEMPGAEVGADSIAPDDAELVMTPQEALTAYAEILDDPDADEADAFADTDPFREQFATGVEQLNEAVAEAGEAESVASVEEDPEVRGLRTADGGAIVTGSLNTETTIQRTEAGSTLNLGGVTGTLMGDDTSVVGSVTTESYVTVALILPPPGADDQTIEVLGATSVVTDVTRDESTNPDENGD